MQKRDWRDHIEWAVHLYKYVRGRALTRWGGFLCLGALALYSNAVQLVVEGAFRLGGVSLNVSETPSGVAYTALGVGALLMVIDRLAPETITLPVAYPQDEKLMQTIRKVFTARSYDFLRTHDFGSPFKSDLLDPVDTIQCYAGPQYAFINRELDLAWSKVRSAAHTLAWEVSERTVPLGIDRQSPVFDGEDRDWYTKEMRDRMAVMNDAAREFTKEWDKFDALARRQVPNVV